MRLRSSFVLVATAALLLSGCTPAPAPSESLTATPSATVTSTPTPTVEPIVEPRAAFDVTCDDVAAEMRSLLGEPSTPVEPVLTTVSTMSWIPGPAQHMFQRAGGIACSAGDDSSNWEVTIVPNAQVVIAGATERQGYWGEQASCEGGYCSFEVPDGDVLVSAIVRVPGLEAEDAAGLEEAMRRLAASAAGSLREVELADSDIVGAPCERFVTAQEVNELAGASDATLYTEFGGWGIPAEVYEYVNGSRICYFTSSGGEYEGPSYLMITTLPAGAWAFERQPGAEAEVEGADAAKTSGGANGENVLDLRIGHDWVRIVTYDNGGGAADPRPFAEKVARNLTVGHTAPE